LNAYSEEKLIYQQMTERQVSLNSKQQEEVIVNRMRIPAMN
jgi:hypothetical protein